MIRKEDTKPVVTFQAIVVLKGTAPEVIAAELVMAGMTTLHQYNPKSNSFVGNYEAGEFTKHWDSWVKDNDLRQAVYFADNIDQLNEVSYLAELESDPMNAFDEDSSVLVLGPFSGERIDYLTTNFTKA